jgi:hypothetical protein
MRRNTSGDGSDAPDRRHERTPACHRLRDRVHRHDALTEGERRNQQHPAIEDGAKLHRHRLDADQVLGPALADDLFSDGFTGLQTAGRASLRGQPDSRMSRSGRS